jgi:tetratricopeptide (TPR) repeat protein
LLRNDYIMRMIEQFVAVMASIAGLKKAGKTDEAASLVRSTAKQLLGLDYLFIDTLSAQGIAEMLKTNGMPDTDRYTALADLLKEDGDILALKGETAKAQNRYSKSLYLYLAAQSAGKPIVTHRDNVKFIAEHFGLTGLGPEEKSPLIAFYESIGEFSKCDDLVFDLMESDPANTLYYRQGISLYERLMKLSPEILEQGNLPSDEVEESLGKLRSMYGLPYPR